MTAGAPLFAVDADLQQSDLNNATAQVAEARARLSRLEAAQQRSEEVAVLEAQEKRAEAMLQLSTAELERQQTLTAKGVGTQAALDTAKSNFNRDKAALEQVSRQITVARLSAREEDIAAARQTLAAAEARRNSAETKLARRKLVSPVERRGAADLLPAGRDGAGGTAGAVDPAARQHQGALLRRRGEAADGRARRCRRGDVRRLREAGALRR